ncbi:MAG: FAD-binding oxidoreductase [Chloroflexota bacterium]|nr:FAD-binding oxidoreductase [Chloroflexota bacterium]
MNNSPAGAAKTGPAVAIPDTTELTSALSGELVLPGHADYESARRSWNKAFDCHPVAIIRCRSTADVVRAVRFATENNLPVGVRSGGHSASGLCVVDDGVVVDLSLMSDLSIDPERRIARVGPGLTWGEYTGRAAEYGLATPGGDSGTVGVGGLTLGGGIGWLARKYGMTIDHLLSAEVVTADGRVLTASETEHPDLFWAIRGGGGNFGIVTSFEFGLVPVGLILGGMLGFPADPALLTSYLRIAAEAPDELSTILMLMLAPPMPMIPAEYHGKPVVALSFCYAGDPQEGQKVIAPLLSMGTPIMQMVQPMPYPVLFQFSAEGATSRPASVRSHFLDDLDDATAAALVEHISRATSRQGILQFRVLGGALSRQPSDSTAFGHRDKPYMATIINAWMGAPADPSQVAEHRAWTEQAWHLLKPHSTGAYVNFLGDEPEEATKQAYPPNTYARLAQIKQRYDPTNLFKGNRNIPPAPPL